MAESGARAAVMPGVGFVAGAVLITCCAFTLPRLPKAAEAIGPWPVWGGFFVLTLLAGWLFWSNIQKLYAVLKR